jgi:diketogulonate reductase-like aldo/keto reductase
VELREEGLIRHIGVSNVTSEQVAEARSITSIVCVQNIYNLAYRHDDELIDALAAQGVAYVPFPARRIQPPAVVSALGRGDTTWRVSHGRRPRLAAAGGRSARAPAAGGTWRQPP